MSHTVQFSEPVKRLLTKIGTQIDETHCGETGAPDDAGQARKVVNRLLAGEYESIRTALGDLRTMQDALSANKSGFNTDLAHAAEAVAGGGGNTILAPLEDALKTAMETLKAANPTRSR